MAKKKKADKEIEKASKKVVEEAAEEMTKKKPTVVETLIEGVKEAIKPEATVNLRQVLTFLGAPDVVVLEANKKIAELEPAWEAQPIEFTKINNSTLQITINFKKNGDGNAFRIFQTKIPSNWKFTASRNHPVIFFGEPYYFGIAIPDADSN